MDLAQQVAQFPLTYGNTTGLAPANTVLPHFKSPS
jgi:hypothetical protein